MHKRHERFQRSWKVTFDEITHRSRGCIPYNLCILMICVFRCILATSCLFQKSIWASAAKQTHTNTRKTELAQLPAGISLRKLNRLFILLAEKDRKMSVPVLDGLCDIVKSFRQHIIHGKAVAEFLCTYPQRGSPPKHSSLPSFHTQKVAQMNNSSNFREKSEHLPLFFRFTPANICYDSTSRIVFLPSALKSQQQTLCWDTD